MELAIEVVKLATALLGLAVAVVALLPKARGDARGKQKRPQVLADGLLKPNNGAAQTPIMGCRRVVL